jgi:hypothetical protein
MSNKKIIAILVDNPNYQSLINLNNLLYEEILKEFKELYIIDFQNLIFFKKKKINKKVHFIFKNIKIFRPNSALEFIKFFEKKKLIAFNNLGKGFSTFRIYYILNKVNLTHILLLSLGGLSNTVEIKTKNIKRFFSSLYFFFNRKIARYVFKFLTIIDIFPKYDYYLDSSRPIIRNMNSSFIRKIERLCPKIKISFFRKAININSRSYDGLSVKKYSNEKKYLVFVDSFFEHKDRVIREGPIEKKNIIEYYSTLARFLKKLSKIYNKKVIFCSHPSNNSKLFQNYLKNFTIKKGKTHEMIRKSFITLFHDSSSIFEAIMLKKKIIILKSDLLGDYLSNRVKEYEKLLNLQSVDMNNYHSLKKSKLDPILNSSNNNNYYVNNYLNADGVIPGYKKIIKLLKKIS